MQEEDAVNKAITVVVTEEIAENERPINDGGSKKRRKSGKGNDQRERKGQAQPVMAEDPAQVIKARFAACGRCCYFLGSYTSAHGEGELETAVQNGLAGWLTLTWDQHTRNLVHKAFGVQLDVDYYFYEGCCVSCYRQFSFRVDEVDGAVFRVQL